MTAPGPPTEHDTGHAAAVRAASVWADTLIDKTGRNELLYCKDRGKILLGLAEPTAIRPLTAIRPPTAIRLPTAIRRRRSDGDPATDGVDATVQAAHNRVEPLALARLLRGETVRLRQLFRDEAAYQTVAKTAESIRRRIKEYDEERGVRIGRLTYGFATWTDFRPPATRRGAADGAGDRPAIRPPTPSAQLTRASRAKRPLTVPATPTTSVGAKSVRRCCFVTSHSRVDPAVTTSS